MKERDPNMQKRVLEKKDCNTPDEEEDVLLGIPAYNEELSIGSVLHKSKKVEEVDDILVVDDGSEDETSEIAKDYGVDVVRHQNNAGKGAAIQTIMDHAREEDYDYLVLMDGDGQHNPYEIPNVLSPLVNPGADMVVGARWGELTEMPFYRKIGKNVLDYLTPGGDKAKDTQSGFRALNRKAIDELNLNEHDFTVESEMVVEADESDLEIKSARISCRYDDVDNASTEGPIAHGMNVMKKIVRLTIERRPLIYLGLPGVIFFLGGIISGLMVLRFHAQHQAISIGWGMLTLVLVLMGSVFVTSGFILNELRQLVNRKSEETSKKAELYVNTKK